MPLFMSQATDLITLRRFPKPFLGESPRKGLPTSEALFHRFAPCTDSERHPQSHSSLNLKASFRQIRRRRASLLLICAGWKWARSCAGGRSEAGVKSGLCHGSAQRSRTTPRFDGCRYLRAGVPGYRSRTKSATERNMAHTRRHFSSKRSESRRERIGLGADEPVWKRRLQH